MLIRCWDTRVQSYPTSARKIFGVAKKRRVSAEKCSYRSIKRLICLMQKHWSKRWVLGTSNRCPDHLSRQFLTTASTFPYSSKNSSAEHIHAFLYITLRAWVWMRQCVYVCVCVFVYVSVYVMASHVNKARLCSAEECVCVCARVCVYACVWVWKCVCVSMCLCEWVCLWWWAMLIKREYVRLRNQCLCVCMCLSMWVSEYVCDDEPCW